MKIFNGVIIILLFPLLSLSQNNPQKFRAKSGQTFAYHITAGEADQFINWDSIPLSHFVAREPVMIFNADSVDEDKLAVGNYVLIDTRGIYLNAEIVCISNVVALHINNRNKLQLDIRNKEGIFISNASVFVNGEEASYNNDSKTFWVKKKYLDGALVKVCTPGDTLFLALTEKEDYDIKPISEQRRHNFRQTTLFRYLNLVPSKIKKLFGPKYYARKSTGAKGFIVFNQPKYKPLDTVRFKGYVVDKKGRQYGRNIDVFINYNNKGKNYNQLVGTIRPVSPGAYVGHFVLADTMPMDINCRLIFRTIGSKEIIQNQFSIEDYVLDEIGTYDFKSDKETYFKNDSIRFFAAARDANGLNVMDARARLILTTRSIDEFYQDTVFVRDTIYNKEIPLATNGDTKFIFPATDLPKADLSINARLIFKNSNNEQHEEDKIVTFKYLIREILVTQLADSLKAVYIEDGIEKTAIGEMSWNDELDKPVYFPVTLKIDPIAEDYRFFISEKNGRAMIDGYFEVETNYQLTFSRISNGDTLGFVLNNPFSIPVYFTVFNGNSIIATGKQETALVSWKTIVGNRKQSYKIRWQYIWAGKEHQGEETIGLLYKLLNIKINSSLSVYPGQKDSIRIDVRDYVGKPASNVNLTAVSYNNQFNKDIRMQEPPYLARYKGRKYLMQNGYEKDNDHFSLTKKYLLGKNKLWIDKFHLDSMAYYKLLFPAHNYADEVSLINELVPQVSVNVVQQGVPQEIYLLYLNRQLVYYNGVTDRMKYAFEVYPGYVQIGIRLKDKYIEIDSLYIQPNYKHDLSFDLGNLPPQATIMNAENFWSYSEMNLLEQTTWQMRNDPQNNYAMVWQQNKLVKLSGNHNHIAGPFGIDSITFYNPGSFDIAFKFEPGYQYSLSRQVARLEKRSLFAVRNLNNILPVVETTSLILGDTIIPAPAILYPQVEKPLVIRSTGENQYKLYGISSPGNGNLQFNRPKDSLFTYYILEPVDGLNKRIMIPGSYNTNIKDLSPGRYSLLMITYGNWVAQVNDIVITAGGTTCVKTNSKTFTLENNLLQKIISENQTDTKPVATAPDKSRSLMQVVPGNMIYSSDGNGLIIGSVVDKKGISPVPGALITLKGFNKGVSADISGNFIIRGLQVGRYILQGSAVGYETMEVEINIGLDEKLKLAIQLIASSQSLNEVVVTGYGTSKKRNLTGSVTAFSGVNVDVQHQLQGRVAGVQVNGISGTTDKYSNILIRGMSSVNSNGPLYVVDGILSETPPANLDGGNIQEISVLKEAEATAIYGARGANGVILITTKTKIFRQQFKDYALWQPNFFTDKNGHASIEINYPDNITGWRTFIVAMDKQRRVGKASVLVQAYKPMVAELSVPQFLIDGDSIDIIGKSKNYTADSYTVTTGFTVEEKALVPIEKTLMANDANIESVKISNRYADTLKVAFTLESHTGFKDGEQRTIPVFKKGTEEAIGNFWVLQQDTTVSFTANPGSGKLHLYAQNNTIDLMLEELEHLRRYPYYCMEQTASKLTGLALEKRILEQLKQPFKNQRELDRLLKKLQKAQLFDGGWAWWENGKTNFYITNYIVNALLPFKGNALVEMNIRNAYLYLQNQLPTLNKGELLSALYTLSNDGHEINYSQWMSKLNYDSLTQHQQWQWVSIKQEQKMDFRLALQKLIHSRTTTILGGVHWGNQNYTWYSNDIATTILAYKVLENDPENNRLCASIVQYFLEKRNTGYWNNTVESASILDVILPRMLADQSDVLSAASLSITGDTSFQVNKFPHQFQTDMDKIRNIDITKKGGGMIYFTAYQQIFNGQPAPVSDKFILRTFFQKNNEPVTTIRAGEKIKMVVNITALHDAEYVQMEIPIPAGCNYASKNNSDWKLYKEYFKNKVMLFSESLTKGSHQFEIELEPRYSGTYTLNPAKASLMYYPVFFGRNEMKKLIIQ